MNIDTTTILAIWGALLSTFAISWNVYRDFIDKGRLKVDCYIGKHIVDGIGVVQDNLLIWSITNIGKRSVILMHIGGSLAKDDFIIDTKTKLPHKLEPGEYITEHINDLRIFKENVRALFVVDTLGKKYKAPKKRLKQVIDSTRKKIKSST